MFLFIVIVVVDKVMLVEWYKFLVIIRLVGVEIVGILLLLELLNFKVVIFEVIVIVDIL